jgi:hypothetical protein
MRTEVSKLDRFDICEMLNGINILSLDTEELEKVDFLEIVEGLLLHYENVRQHGKDEYIALLQREGRFSAFENDAAGLVSGLEINPLKIRQMPEHALRTWLIGYLGMLSRGRRENERSIIAIHSHVGIGW